MSDIDITWDENKNQSNKKKHKVSFEEAETVFSDEKAILYDDPDHSKDEERFLLLVCHCYRENDRIIRIISARKAKKKEAIKYEEQI